jgi:hypothetical protein
MKIDVNTSSEEVKQKPKEVLQSLCNVKNNQTDNDENLHELFDIKKKNIKSEISLLDYDVIQKVIELQEIIFNKKQKVLSIEKIIDFLKSAMNYGKFQIWLSECTFNGIKLTINDKLREFFNLISVEEILNIYDIECGYDNSIISESEQGLVKKLVLNNKK